MNGMIVAAACKPYQLKTANKSEPMVNAMNMACKPNCGGVGG
jgi:hypothetical protein